MDLTTKDFWDSHHKGSGGPPRTEPQSRKGWFRQLVDNARLRQGAVVGQGYNHFALHQLIKTHLPKRRDWSVIEIGSAPGNNLVTLNRNCGYVPYGVEYSSPGVMATRETFARHGWDTNNVIEADFFDSEFHERFKNRFDVVFSYGFVEHFDPPNEAVALHVNLLKPGGYLVCQIPNLRGVCYPYLRLCAREQLQQHNCTIMRKKPFQRLFEPFGLDTKFCGYVGAFDLHASSYRHERSLHGYLAAGLDRAQDLLDHSMFLLHQRRFPQSGLSASLVFIGHRAS